MRVVLPWMHRSIEALAAFGVIAFACAAVVTVADVVGRRIGLPVEGVVDLVQLFTIAGAWCVIPWAFVTGAHVTVDYVIALMPGWLERVVKSVAAVIAGVLLFLMLRYGYDAFQLQQMLGDRSQQLGIPIRWYWLPLLLGQAASVLALLVVLIELGWRSRREAIA